MDRWRSAAVGSRPGNGWGPAVEVVVRADVIVPGSEEIEIELLIDQNRLLHPPELLECSEESLDPPVLPWGERGGPLVADSEGLEAGSE